jgi:hypothetical protein
LQKKTLTLFIVFLSVFGCKKPKALEVINDNPQACPSNFVLVPGNTTFSTEDFCVAKFHTKNSAGTAVVTAAGAPWDGLDATTAQAKCEAMTEAGFTGTFSLISNPEWMTIARNAEAVTDNWSSGVVGTGWFVRGHSDGTPNNSLAVTDESDPYNGTGNNAMEAAGSGWQERRTLKLSNGNIVWDFSGNVWSWVDWDSSDTGFTLGPTDATNAVKELNVLEGSVSALDLQSAGGYLSSQGLGQWHGGNGGAAMRGGRWANTLLAGVYSLYLDEPSSHTSTHLGFRCVYRK